LAIEHDAFVPVLHEPAHHVAAHSSKSDHSDLHVMALRNLIDLMDEVAQ